MIPGDGFFSNDLFRREPAVSETTLISTSNFISRDARGTPDVSDDGQVAVYQQAVFDDPNNTWGVYIADDGTGVIDRVPLTIEGNSVDIAYLDATAVSGNGRYVTIASKVSGTADDLLHDLFVFDRQSGMLAQPGLRPTGVPGDGSIYDPAIDFDGRYIAFVSDDSHLVSDDNNGVADVFVYDSETGSISRASVAHDGGETDAASWAPSISSDGRYIAFRSAASNLVENDNNQSDDIFVYDRLTHDIERVSVSSVGGEANGDSGAPAISGDGRFVAFESTANNLDSGHASHVPSVDANRTQVYVFDRVDRTTTSVSRFSSPSTLLVSGSTLAFNSGNATVAGNVTTTGTLYAGNTVAGDLGAGSVSLGYNLIASATDLSKLQSTDIVDSTSATRLSPFQSLQTLPPGYLLLQGNAAIDAAASDREGMPDQWGRTRNNPDIGALEAVSASVTGTVFVDDDADLAQGSDEQGLAELTVFVDLNGDGVRQPDEPSTISSLGPTARDAGAVAGQFHFDALAPGPKTIRVVTPEHWRATGEPIVRAAIGTKHGNGDSTQAAISPDGQLIAFLSTADNLTTGDTSDPSLFILSILGQSIAKVPVSGVNLKPIGFVGQANRFLLIGTDAESSCTIASRTVWNWSVSPTTGPPQTRTATMPQPARTVDGSSFLRSRTTWSLGTTTTSPTSSFWIETIIRWSVSRRRRVAYKGTTTVSDQPSAATGGSSHSYPTRRTWLRMTPTTAVTCLFSIVLISRSAASTSPIPAKKAMHLPMLP
ncbi:MAG: hypothetical protein R3C05_21420 [Pirellulaceae bacterium]